MCLTLSLRIQKQKKGDGQSLINLIGNFCGGLINSATRIGQGSPLNTLISIIRVSFCIVQSV